MGGDLKYFSRSGVGATFEFTAKFNLPDDQEEPLEAYKNYGVSPTALAALQGKTILLIDGLPVRRLVRFTKPRLLQKFAIGFPSLSTMMFSCR